MLGKKKKKLESEGNAEALSTGKQKKKGKKKFIIIGIVVAAVAAILILPSMLSGGAPLLQVATGTAEKMDIEQVVSIKGTIEGSDKADVVSTLNYEITSILVKEGDAVKKDQVLAVLDIEELRDEYAKAATAFEQAKFAYDTSKVLYEEGAISKDEFLRAESTYKQNQITLNAFDLANKGNVKSPIAGTVTRVNVTVGRYARDNMNNEPMFVIEDLDNLKMDVRISEYDISKIKTGQNVTITADVIGKNSVEGVVSRISPTGEVKDQMSKEMVIPVQIDVLKGDTNLIAGVTARAKILIDKRENVLAVPIESVLEDPDTGEHYLFILQDGVLKKVSVTLGLEGDFHIEILSGDLSEKDQVVLSPTFDMSDGTAATALPQ